MFNKRELGIIYIERTSFTYYSLTGSPQTYKYVPDAVREIEVVNEELFLKDAATFVTQQKFVPGNSLILISPDLLYEKDFIDEQPQPKAEVISQQPMDPTKPLQSAEPLTHKPTLASHEERLREIGLFIESVPFEETASKIYKIDKGVKVIVTNKKLFQTIRTVFTRQGFLVDAVLPMTMLGKEFGTPAGMTDDLVKKIFARFEAAKINNLLQEDPSILGGPTAPGHIQMTTKVQSKREYVLIGIFVLLLLVLGIFAYLTFFVPQTSTKVASISQEIPPTAVPTAVPAPVDLASTSAVASPSGSVQVSTIRVSLSGGAPGQADTLKQLLTRVGFTQIIIKPATSPSGGKVLIIFSSTVTQPVRETILNQVKSINASISVQESVLTDTDVLVNL